MSAIMDFCVLQIIQYFRSRLTKKAEKWYLGIFEGAESKIEKKTDYFYS